MPDLIARLPRIEGATYTANVPLAPYTTIEVGGPAEVLAVFENWPAVQAFLKNKPVDVPFTIIGKGSNMVVADAGIKGVVAHFAKGLDAVRIDGNTVYAEAGAACGTVARNAREAGLAGLEFFGGIPGSVGGALRMNAGAYGHETFHTLTRLYLLDDQGNEHAVEPAYVNARYRHTELPQGWLYKAAEWVQQPGDKEAIRARMQEINRARSTTQPLALPSSGSWFKNPTLPHDVEGVGKTGEKVNAWKVSDAAGCRGKRVGGAAVSEQHANFFVNIGAKEGTGSATAADLMELSKQVQEQVKTRLGITLETEVRIIGG